jgi:hypothetical protein
MDLSFNIIELIENNPITRLSNTYQNKLLIKIKETFTDIEQQLFVASFYCFLKYNYQTDYIINLDDVWKWLGFSTKQKAKDLLEKHFIIEKDYKILRRSSETTHIISEKTFDIASKDILPNQPVKQTIRGGHNKEIILLNIYTFKKFCLKTGTKKSDEIHDYFIKLESLLQSIIEEESNELKMQIEESKRELHNNNINNEKEKDKIREQALLEQFPKNTQCIYYGIIDNISNKNEKLIKFGNSNNLKARIIKHRETYLNFCLINAFRVDNKLQIENALKINTIFIERQRTIVIKNKKYVELLSIDGITFDELDNIIKGIIQNIEYSPENYKKIIEENIILKTQLKTANEINNTNELILLKSENDKIKNENTKLLKKILSLEKTYVIQNDNESEYANTPEQLISRNNIIQLTNTRIKKNNDGKYTINNIIYETLVGSRQDVWNGVSYKTTGGLTKNDLLINKNNKIISKKKYIQEKTSNRFKISK